MVMTRSEYSGHTAKSDHRRFDSRESQYLNCLAFQYLTLINQYLDQVPRDISRGVLGNVGNWAVFRVGSADAQVFADEFSPFIILEQLQRQRNHSVIYRLLANGISTIPTSARTLPPKEHQGNEADPETIISISRKRYGKNREDVERKILAPWTAKK